MKTYIYKLKDESGKSLYGFRHAYSKKDLRSKFKDNRYYFISAVVCDPKKIFQQKVDLDTLLMFTRRLSSLIESGLPILSAMNVLWRQTEDKNMQMVISHMQAVLEEGKRISEALNKFPNIFPLMFRAMIAVAERAGGLVAVLRKLTIYLEYQKQIVTRTKKATLYPSFVIIFAFLVVVGMFAFVVPTFQKILFKLDVELPLLTRIVLAISQLLRSPIFIVCSIVTIVSVIVGYRILNKKPKYSYHIDFYKLKIPFIGYILYSASMSRFVHSLSMLVGSGLPIVESFDVAKTTTQNTRIVSSISEVQSSVKQGISLYDSFKDIKMFPVMLIEMIGVGEKSGQIVKVLDSLAKHFDEEVEYNQNKFFTMLEPMLIIVVGFIVAVTLGAIYLPVFSIWSSLLGK